MNESTARIDAMDRRLIVATQAGLPLTSRPFAAVAEQLARDAAEILATPEVRERLKAQGMTDAAMKPAALAAAAEEVGRQQGDGQRRQEQERRCPVEPVHRSIFPCAG